MTVVNVAAFSKVCATREKGRSFYPLLLERARAAHGELTVSFEGVEFVTPSFLHETVAKLLAEVPSIVHSIQIEGLREFPAQELGKILRTEDLDVELSRTGPTSYRLAALV